jgi:hypothetical protein
MVCYKPNQIQQHLNSLKIFDCELHQSEKFCVKCNSDGASSRVLGRAACGGMFRSSQADHLDSFANNLGIVNAFRAEPVAAMLAIEIAFYKGRHNL